MPRKRETDEVLDEERIGTSGRGGLVARVQVNGSAKRFTKSSSAELLPGSVVRVAVGASGVRGKSLKAVARLLAFVDPITGELVIRMGMYDITNSTKGDEVGPQIVWRSDVPVCDIDTRTR